jgi:hypothetical protein
MADFGEPTRNEAIAVTTTQASISEAKKRKEFVITNSATAAQIAAGHLYATISVGQEAADGAGIILYPGGVWYGSINGEFKPTHEKVYAVANGGTGRLSIFER